MKNTSSNFQQKYPPWHLIEKKIQEEINWLRNLFISISG